MDLDFSIIISGQAGQGVQLLAEILGRALVRHGFFVFASMDVMSRIRGGHNRCRLRITARARGADTGVARLLVALDPVQAGFSFPELSAGSVVLTDDSTEVHLQSENNWRQSLISTDGGQERHKGIFILQLPLVETALAQGRSKVMANMVAAGAVLGLLGLDPEVLCWVVEERFGNRDQEGARRNVACIRKGFELIVRRARKGTLALSRETAQKADGAGRVFMTGAQAIALGAVAGGVRFVAGYPMSPGTPVLEACASWQEKTGIIVEQAEDEIAAVNMAIGASFAGALGMVATAGGGMCLMNEGISLAGMTETSLVVVSGMRPGPATGLATRTAQADLLFALSCGHGEFPRAVLCPGTAEQAFSVMQRACNLAVKYQIPVIVLFDQFMGDAYWTCEERALGVDIPVSLAEVVQKHFDGPYTYRRYELTEGGVSPLILPGTKDQLVYVDSDEHTPEGHITESAEVRNRMVRKRLAKLPGIATELVAPERYPNAEAETVIFCFGSLRGAVQEAVELLNGALDSPQRGGTETGGGVSSGADVKKRVAMVHFCDLWPFPERQVIELVGRARRFLTVEGNYTAQLAQLITQETGLKIDGSVRRYDGRPLTVIDVVQGLQQLGV